MPSKLLNLLLIFMTLESSAKLTECVGLFDLIDISLPNDCNQTIQYYDASKLSCQNCPFNSVPVDSKKNF